MLPADRMQNLVPFFLGETKEGYIYIHIIYICHIYIYMPLKILAGFHGPEMEVDGSGHFPKSEIMGPMAVGEAAVHLPGYQGDELG